PYSPAKNTGSPDALSTIDPYTTSAGESVCASIVKPPIVPTFTDGNSAGIEYCSCPRGASCTNAVASCRPLTTSATFTPIVVSPPFTNPAFERKLPSARRPVTYTSRPNALIGSASIDCPYVPPSTVLV